MLKSRRLLAKALHRASQRRSIQHTAARRDELYNPKTVERVEDEVDVCIVGAGPAGLSAAIRIKQLEREKGKEIRVVVLEKGGEVGECAMRRPPGISSSNLGAHILSGGVLEPRALYELLGDPATYEEKYGSKAPLDQPATSSKMIYLTNKMALPLPHPPQMGNKGTFICTLEFTC